MSGRNILDEALDTAERFVDGIEQFGDVLDRAFGKQSPAPVATSKNLARTWRIIEALDAQTGSTIYIVTNGSERCETMSKDFAERVRIALVSA